MPSEGLGYSHSELAEDGRRVEIMSSCRISINFLLNPQGDKHLGAPAEHPRSREDSRFSQPDPGSE
jgi:hypothetical protein